jgi:mannosyltransferase
MRSARARDAVLVGAPALLAFGLCLIQIDGRSLGFDEAATVAIASEHGASLRAAIAHDGGNMSGYYVLLHLLISAFGDGGLVLHLPSAIAAGAGVALTSALGLRLFDRRVALAAGLLMAVSLPLVFWGQNARSYAILVALSVGSFLAFAVLLDSSRPHWAWIAYVLCTVLALYASLMAVLIVLAQVLVLAWHRPRRGDAVTAAIGAVAVLSSPLMILISNRGSGQLFWVSHPDFRAVRQVAESVTSAGLEPTIHRTSTTYVLLVLTVVVLLAVGAAIVARQRRWPTPLLLLWLVVPIGFALIESFIGPAIFVPRNLLMVLPAIALLLAWGLTRIGAAGWVVLAALIALRALQLAPTYGVSPEDWRASTAYVMQSARPGDCIAFYPSDGRNGFRYYANGTPPRSVLPAVPWAYERAYIETYTTLTKDPSRCRRMWLVASHQGRLDGPKASRSNLAQYRSLRARLSAAYGVARARQFGYADPITVELFGPRPRS